VPLRPAPSPLRTPPPLPVTPGDSPSSTSHKAESFHLLEPPPPPPFPLPPLPPLPPQSLQVPELVPELVLELVLVLVLELVPLAVPT